MAVAGNDFQTIDLYAHIVSSMVIAEINSMLFFI